MKYLIDGKIIKAHNAARSPLQTNKYMDEFINYRIPKTKLILDYGCGKGRYIRQLKRKCKNLIAVDSKLQLSRVHTINGERTKLNKYYNNKGIRFIEEGSNLWKSYSYNFAFLINVLSAVPNESTRLLILTNIKNCLADGGKIIMCTKHNDKFFRELKLRNNSKCYEDGYIYTNCNGTYFYGIINYEKLKYYGKLIGAKDISGYNYQGSAYAILEF